MAWSDAARAASAQVRRQRGKTLTGSKLTPAGAKPLQKQLARLRVTRQSQRRNALADFRLKHVTKTSPGMRKISFAERRKFLRGYRGTKEKISKTLKRLRFVRNASKRGGR